MREVSQLAIGAKVVDVGKGAKGAGEVAKYRMCIRSFWTNWE